MNYHNITYPDQNNGDGLRVVLWVSGCSHHCRNCQNPQTWNPENGIMFDNNAKKEILNELKNTYISGITFSGGDPLYVKNLGTIEKLIDEIRVSLPNKTIWLYTGYTWEYVFGNNSNEPIQNLIRQRIISKCDVVIDGEYIEELRDITLHWRGSLNQRVINVKETLKQKRIILWES